MGALSAWAIILEEISSHSVVHDSTYISAQGRDSIYSPLSRSQVCHKNWNIRGRKQKPQQVKSLVVVLVLVVGPLLNDPLHSRLHSVLCLLGLLLYHCQFCQLCTLWKIGARNTTKGLTAANLLSKRNCQWISLPI